jgi:hypothetical protein
MAAYSTAMPGSSGARNGDSRYSRSMGRKVPVMTAQPASPAVAHSTGPVPVAPAASAISPASAVAGGSAYSQARPIRVPASSSGE